MVKKIAGAFRKAITADWQAVLPSLGVYEPMHLLRRCGPLLIGVALETSRDHTSYWPVSHVHCLLSLDDDIRLTLYEKLPIDIAPLMHERGRYRDFAAELRAKAALPVEGALSLSDTIAGYQRYLEGHGNEYLPELYEEMALMTAYFGRVKEAREILARATTVVRGWPDYIFDEDREWFRSAEVWAASVESRLDRARLEQTLTRNLVALKATHLPAEDMSA